MAGLTKPARLDAAVGLSALFMALPDTSRDEGIARTLRQKWKGGLVIIMGRVMSSFPQDILLALLAAARDGNAALPGEDMIADGESGMGQAEGREVISLRVTYPRLAELSGHTNSTKFRAAARDAVQMLAGVTVRGEGADGSFAVQRLISGAAGEGRKGVSVTLNWRLSLAVLGGGIYGSIPLAERHQLDKTARIVHAWLACWLGAKTRGSISLAALAAHIFPTGKKPTARQQRFQQSALKRAMGVIGGLDAWQIGLDAMGVAHIERQTHQNSTTVAGKQNRRNSTTVAAKQYHRRRPETLKASIGAG